MSDERIDKIEKEFAEFRKDFKDVSEALKSMASEKAQDYESRARVAFRQAQNKAEHVFSDVRDHFDDATDRVENRVRENPLTALAVVAGLGFLIGFCSRR